MEKNNKTERLQQLYELYGNCPQTGYIGNLQEFTNQDNGVLHFTSINHEQGETNSEGFVLSNAIVIVQNVAKDNREDNHMFIWDDISKNKKYTYIEFDDLKAMLKCFMSFNANDLIINHSDIAETLKGMGINFENITQILTSQTLNPLEEMLNDEDQDTDKPTLTM